MRWIPFILLAYLVLLVQTTLGGILVIHGFWMGAVGPDLAALLVVFVALWARNGVDVMLAAWLLGLGVDLTTAGGPGAGAVVGPMPIAYSLLAGVIFRLREAFFRESAISQGFLAMCFCFLAHGVWLAMQSVLTRGELSWGALVQVAAVALYTALLMPLAHFGLVKMKGLLLVAPSGRSRRG